MCVQRALLPPWWRPSTGKGRVVDEHFDGCSYLVEQADAKAMAEAARKVETVGGSVKLVLKKLPEDA